MANNDGFRRFGIVLVGEVPWGTHLCQFYENKEDLIDILVPYFAEGLRNNEFCLWVTSPPLEVEEARAALSKALPNLDEYFRKGQIEILSYDNWYLLGAKFDPNIVLEGWVQKEKDAIQRGFDGLRLSGNTFWIEQNLWGRFTDYEETVNAVVAKHKMIALCTYCLKNCSGTDVVDVERNHVGTLIKQGQKWSLVEDVVHRKKAERKIENLAKFPSENPNPIFRIDGKGTILYSNQAGLSLFTTWNIKVGECAPEHISRVVADALASNKRIELEETFETKTFSLLFAPITLEGYVNIYANDVTERKKAEDNLQQSFERFKLLSDSTSRLLASDNPQTIVDDLCTSAMNYLKCDCFFNFLVDESTGKLRLNAYAGIPQEDAKKIEWLDYGEAVCGCVAQRGQRIVAEDIQHTPDVRTEFVKSFGVQAYACYPLSAQGHVLGTLSFGTRSRISYTSDELGLMKTVSDQVATAMQRIINEKALQEGQSKLEEYAANMEALAEERARKLKDAERLAAIGATAGMVGHDIRNPLQAITSDVYLVKTELASTPESGEKKNAFDSLQEIEKNIEYIDKIVADLQDFARPLSPRSEEADLKLIIDDLLSKNNLPENVKASVKVETEAKKVVADSTFINRIVYNLVNNAVQAMPKGGKLTIHAYRKADDVVIIVKDTGVGIPEGVKSRLFTPMFTTKAKGQGFGLAVVKRMTEALGGTVTFVSQEGKGTTFMVRLPSKS